MPRYAILEHDHPQRHWDFFLEAGDVLRAWRLAAPPQPGRSVPAKPASDHRKAYLDYEGPVSGGRGSVTRWDAGSFQWVEDGKDRVVVFLEGGRWRGMAVLAEGADGGWTLTIDSAVVPAG